MADRVTGERLVVGTSLKAYFDRARMTAWTGEVARLAAAGDWSRDVELFVLPDLLGVPRTVEALAGSGIAVGAQDVSERPAGATTGDVPAARLAEEGCTLAAVGHAERRARHGETDQVVAAKVAQLGAVGLTPVLCVGETEPGAEQAVETCVAQVRAALAGWPAHRRVLVAYEPVWAIGAERPADAGYVRAVLGEFRGRLTGHRLSYLYGGSAQPGLLTEIADVADGIFLGRFAHDPAALAAVVAEAGSLRST